MPIRERAPTRHVVVEQLRKLCLEIGPSGTVLPGEPKLASQLGVGRATVRDALTRLEAEGLILRRQGADTIVNAAALDLAGRIELDVDFAEVLKACGFEAEMHLLDSGCEPLPADVAEALALDAETPALRTLKRWDADATPVMVAVDWVPIPEEGLGDADPDPSQPVFELAARLGGEEVAWEVAYPGAVALDDEIADALETEPGSPVWTLERVGIGRSGRRVSHAFEYHVPAIVQYGFVRSLRRP